MTVDGASASVPITLATMRASTSQPMATIEGFLRGARSSGSACAARAGSMPMPASPMAASNRRHGGVHWLVHAGVAHAASAMPAHAARHPCWHRPCRHQAGADGGGAAPVTGEPRENPAALLRRRGAGASAIASALIRATCAARSASVCGRREARRRRRRGDGARCRANPRIAHIDRCGAAGGGGGGGIAAAVRREGGGGGAALGRLRRHA